MTLAALYLYAAGAMVFYGATPLARFASHALGLRARYWWMVATWFVRWGGFLPRRQA